MYILAIDTSSTICSVAIATEYEIKAEITISNNLTNSENIMPIIQNLFHMSKIDKHEINYIACTSGPGSFTGLRVGACIAKGIAYGLNIPIIPVPTLEVLAYNVFDTNNLIVPIITCKNKSIYSATYEYNSDYLSVLDNIRVIDFDNLLQSLKKSNKKIVFVADNIFIYKDEIYRYSNNFCIYNNNIKKASCLASIAFKKIDEAVLHNEFVPRYFKKTQAEEQYKGEKI